jgi:hypothetical protein
MAETGRKPQKKAKLKMNNYRRNNYKPFSVGKENGTHKQQEFVENKKIQWNIRATHSWNESSCYYKMENKVVHLNGDWNKT